MARENGDETMKTVRVPCNFCEFSRYERTPQEQEHDNEAVVSMEGKLKRLRLLTRRITGKDLDGVSLPELELLESQLKNVRQIVQNQRTQVMQEEFERLRNQMKQAASEDGIKRGPLVPCNFSGISSEERPQKQDDEAPTPVTALQRAYERRLAEPMESEVERLWLLNERMNGRKLEGMTLFELFILEGQLSESLLRILDVWSDRKAEHKEMQLNRVAEQERCSLDNVKDEDHHGKIRRVRRRKSSPICSVTRI